MAELFGGTADSYPLVTDPCRAPKDPGVKARCAANGVPGGASGDPSVQLLEKIAASPSLGPESATTFTAGVVVQPRMVRNLSITVDYYNLNVSKAISTYSAAFILSNCYVTGVLPSLCSNVIRDANGLIIQIDDPRSNLGTFHTAGVDFAIRYAYPIPDFGRVSLILDGTYLHDFRRTDITGIVTDGTGRSGTHAPDRHGAGVSARYIGSYHECFAGGDYLCAEDDTMQHHIPAYMPFDVFVSYTLRDWIVGTTSAVFGVNNAFNADPPFLATAFAANSDPSTYDYVGRFLHARLTHQF